MSEVQARAGRAGIDAGATLWKLARVEADRLELESVPAGALAEVGENIGLSCAALARSRGLETVVFGGSAVSASSLLGEILRLAAQVGGAEARLLPDGAYCGAVGAAAAAPAEH